MRRIPRAPISALTTALLLAGGAVGQPPQPRPEPPQRLIQLAAIRVDDIIERILSFDKDKKGKVTKGNLPERMQFLVDLGDTNKDGALDKEEIRKLATKLAVRRGGFGGGGQIRVGPGPRPAPGAPVGFGVALRAGTDAMEGVVEDLRLSGKRREQAMAAVKAHQENVRKLMHQARAELLEKMKAILSEDEFKDFKAALDRPRGATTIISVGPRDLPDGGGPRNLDPPRK